MTASTVQEGAPAPYRMKTGPRSRGAMKVLGSSQAARRAAVNRKIAGSIPASPATNGPRSGEQVGLQTLPGEGRHLGGPIHKHNGPYPVPAWNLRAAAIEYAAAVELSSPDLPQTWDRLRKAAERYTHAHKRRGRPRRSVPLRREEG